MGLTLTDRASTCTRGHSRPCGLVVNVEAREVFLAGRLILLTRTEFDLLAILHRNPRRVLTPEILLAELWDSSFVDSGHPIEVYVHRLRKKLGESGRAARYIHTVRGVGYRFEPDTSEIGHVKLTYDVSGTLVAIHPANSYLWGKRATDWLGTSFNPVAAFAEIAADVADSPADARWEIHVSLPSRSSTDTPAKRMRQSLIP